MTSISALSSGSYQSPLQKLQAELQTEVNSGAIGSSDQTALSSALTDIDSALQGGQTGSPSSPGDLKTKIDSLIAGEVSSGKLTSDQATELKGVFKAAFAHGHGGARGGPPPSDESTADSSSASTSSPSDLLKQLIKLLQNAQSSSSSYDATGSSGSSGTQGSSGSALLIDYKT